MTECNTKRMNEANLSDDDWIQKFGNKLSD